MRTNLIDFLGEWDFSRLRRIVDLILLDLGGGDKKKGVAEVIRRGWADEPECTRVDESLNFGNKDYLGAHPRLDRRPGQNKDPMSLVMASEFVRTLLARWIEFKARGVRCGGDLQGQRLQADKQPLGRFDDTPQGLKPMS